MAAGVARIRKDVQVVQSEKGGLGYDYCYDNEGFVFKIYPRRKNGTSAIKCENLGCTIVGSITSDRTTIVLPGENHNHDTNRQLPVENEPVVIDLTAGEQIEIIPPATFEEIERSSNEYSYTPSETIEHGQCAICKVDYVEGDQLMILRCMHFQHAECLRRCLRLSGRCPVCRRTI